MDHPAHTAVRQFVEGQTVLRQIDKYTKSEQTQTSLLHTLSLSFSRLGNEYSHSRRRCPCLRCRANSSSSSSNVFSQRSQGRCAVHQVRRVWEGGDPAVQVREENFFLMCEKIGLSWIVWIGHLLFAISICGDYPAQSVWWWFLFSRSSCILSSSFPPPLLFFFFSASSLGP